MGCLYHQARIAQIKGKPWRNRLLTSRGSSSSKRSILLTRLWRGGSSRLLENTPSHIQNGFAASNIFLTLIVLTWCQNSSLHNSILIAASISGHGNKLGLILTRALPSIVKVSPTASRLNGWVSEMLCFLETLFDHNSVDRVLCSFYSSFAFYIWGRTGGVLPNLEDILKMRYGSHDDAFIFFSSFILPCIINRKNCKRLAIRNWWSFWCLKPQEVMGEMGRPPPTNHITCRCSIYQGKSSS